MSVDPIVHVGNSQAANGYAYVWNNPLAYVDPSGFDAVCGHGLSCPGVPRDPDRERGDDGWRGTPSGPGGGGGSADEGKGGKKGEDKGRIKRYSFDYDVLVIYGVGSTSDGTSSFERWTRIQREFLGGVATGLEVAGYVLIAFDVANTIAIVTAGPDTSLLGVPMVAAAGALRSTAARGATTLYRAVTSRELADIGANAGRYRVAAGGTEGKYFFKTPEQASNFARMMGREPYTTTSIRVSPRELARGQLVNPAREGPGYFFSTPDVPSGPVTIFNLSVLP